MCNNDGWLGSKATRRAQRALELQTDSTHQGRVEALGDMYDALTRFVEAGGDGTRTNAESTRLYAATRAIHGLALLWCIPKVADAVEAFERAHGL